MKRAHITFAPKGGIGKSLIAALIAQWLRDTAQEPVIYDNDPATATLAAYEGLPVRQLQLLREGVINKHAYDEMFMAMANEGTAFVVDNGASNFVELLNYITQSDLMEVMVDIGVKPTVHIPVVGGDDLMLTVAGMDHLATTLSPAADIVVWKNLYKGDLVDGDVSWENMDAYGKHKRRLLAEVELRRRDDMTNDAIQRMLGDRLTFREVAASESYNILEKSRLKRVSSDVYGQLTTIFGVGREVEAA